MEVEPPIVPITAAAFSRCTAFLLIILLYVPFLQPVPSKPAAKDVKAEAVSADPLGFLIEPASSTVTTKPSPDVATKPSPSPGDTAKQPPSVTAKPSPGVTRKPDISETEQKGGSTPKVDPKGPPAVAIKPPKEPTQTFVEDSSDDDLFHDALTTSLKREPPKVTPKPPQAKTPVEQRKSLEDALLSPTSPTSSPARKKPVGGVSLFGGVDIFGGIGKKEEGLFGDSPTSPTKGPPAVVPKPAKVSGTPTPTPTHTHTHTITNPPPMIHSVPKLNHLLKAEQN